MNHSSWRLLTVALSVVALTGCADETSDDDVDSEDKTEEPASPPEKRVEPAVKVRPEAVIRNIG